jgi:3-oxoacyl-[acyl-carrier protein] reductase
VPDDGVIILTGAASGIGRASAEALARRPRTLALVDFDAAPLAEAVEGCRKDSPRSAGFVCDVSDEAAVSRTCQQISKRLGDASVLVNCAGIGFHAPFLEIEPADWLKMFNVNLMGSVYFIREVLPGMIRARSGLIINVGSRRGLEPKAGTAAYSATKAGLLGLTKALVAEVSGHGVKVTYLAPGGTKTKLGTPKDPRFLEASVIADAIVYIVANGGNAWVRQLEIMPLGL